MFQRNILSLAVIATAVIPAVTFAERPAPGTLGRTSSGTPFRVDSEGVRITDQLATLEVENNDLRGQIATLEDQLLRVRESASGKKLPLPVQAIATPPENSRETRCPTVSNCEERVAPLNSQLQVMRSDIEAAKTKVQECQEKLAPLGSEIASLKAALKEAPTQDMVAAANQGKSSVEAQLGSAKEKLRESDDRLRSLSAEMAQAKEDLRLARAESERLKSESDLRTANNSIFREDQRSLEREPVRAALAARPEPVKKEVALQDEPAPMESKSTLQSKLTAIQSKIIERKSLMDRVQSSGKGISVRIQPLVTKGGASLDDLRLMTAKFEQNADRSSEIGAGISEIEGILAQDIELLRRLANRR